MGTWGHRLYESDFAADLRDTLRVGIGDGKKPAAIFRKLIRSECPERWEENEYATFWLALADTAWNLGYLTPLVKRRALNVLDKGIGLQEWDEAKPSLLAKRRQAYKALRKKLASPQPKPKRVAKRKRMTSPYQAGDVLRYQTLAGRHIYIRVLDVSFSGHGDKELVCDICKWKASYPPPAARLGKVARLVPKWERGGRWSGKGLIYLYSRKPGVPAPDRVLRIARKVKFDDKLAYQGVGGSVFGGWAKLDEYLLDRHDIR